MKKDKKRKIKKNQTNRAFTLIELLAVIVILGIVALMGFTSVNKITQNVREKAFIDNAISFASASKKMSTDLKLDEGQIALISLDDLGSTLTSPFGGNYKNACAVVDSSGNVYIEMNDKNGNSVGGQYEEEINTKSTVPTFINFDDLSDKSNYTFDSYSNLGFIECDDSINNIYLSGANKAIKVTKDTNQNPSSISGIKVMKTSSADVYIPKSSTEISYNNNEYQLLFNEYNSSTATLSSILVAKSGYVKGLYTLDIQSLIKRDLGDTLILNDETENYVDYKMSTATKNMLLNAIEYVHGTVSDNIDSFCLQNLKGSNNTDKIYLQYKIKNTAKNSNLVIYNFKNDTYKFSKSCTATSKKIWVTEYSQTVKSR